MPLADIRAVYQDVELGKADMLLSTIVISEIFDILTDDNARETFRQFLRRPNIIVQDVTPYIARLTAELRSEWRGIRANENETREIKTPDAIIITTAVVREVTVLHSHDLNLKRHHKTPLVRGLRITDPAPFEGPKISPLSDDLEDSQTCPTPIPPSRVRRRKID